MNFLSCLPLETNLTCNHAKNESNLNVAEFSLDNPQIALKQTGLSSVETMWNPLSFSWKKNCYSNFEFVVEQRKVLQKQFLLMESVICTNSGKYWHC